MSAARRPGVRARGVRGSWTRAIPGLRPAHASIAARRRRALRRTRRAAAGRRSCASRASTARSRWPRRSIVPVSKRVDVHMSDSSPAASTSTSFRGWSRAAASRYGDVLGAGEGWAKSILFNRARATSSPRSSRARHLRARRVQRLPDDGGASELIPGTEHWPHFVRNRSEQFEARFSWSRWWTPVALLRGMEGSRCRSRWRTAKAARSSRSRGSSRR